MQADLGPGCIFEFVPVESHTAQLHGGAIPVEKPKVWLRSEATGKWLHFGGTLRGGGGERHDHRGGGSVHKISHKVEEAGEALKRDALQLLPMEAGLAAGGFAGWQAAEFVRQVEFALALRNEFKRLAVAHRKMAEAAKSKDANEGLRQAVAAVE